MSFHDAFPGPKRKAPPAWQEPIAMSAAREAEEREAEPPEHADKWSRILAEAASLGPGNIGNLLWVERRWRRT